MKEEEKQSGASFIKAGAKLKDLAIKGAIFDLDGTILDSFPDQFNWYKYCTKKYSNKKFPYKKKDLYDNYRDDYNKYMSPHIWDWYDFLGIPVYNNDKSRNDKLIAEIWEEFRAWKKEAKIPFVRGMKSVLKELYARTRPRKGKPQAFKFALNTYNVWESFGEKFRKNGIDKIFNTVITADDLPKRDGQILCKPHPYSIKKALDLMHVHEIHSIHIGDSCSDIEACKRVKGPYCPNTIAVTWGFESEENLKKMDSDYTIDEPSRIIEIFGDLGAFL